MDRRIQKTRAAIFQAFEELLTKKRYEQITVQDIIDRADIGRSTFYAHFETKDDLLKQTCQDLFSHIFEEHPASESSHDFSGGNATLRSMLTHILYHLQDDRGRYERIFSCESGDLFWMYFKSQFMVLLSRYNVAEKARSKDLPEDFFLDYICSTFIEAVRWWFRSDLQITPEELELYFEKVTG